jgi:small membrane protein
MAGDKMPTLYLVANFLLVLFFIRNYHGVQKKVSARIFVVVFVLAFVLSAFSPSYVTKIANFFGFGRGTDFVFYNFVIFTIGILGLLYKKILLLERRLIALNRQASINEAKAKIQTD